MKGRSLKRTTADKFMKYVDLSYERRGAEISTGVMEKQARDKKYLHWNFMQPHHHFPLILHKRRICF